MEGHPITTLYHEYQRRQWAQKNYPLPTHSTTKELALSWIGITSYVKGSPKSPESPSQLNMYMEVPLPKTLITYKVRITRRKVNSGGENQNKYIIKENYGEKEDLIIQDLCK